MAAHQNLASDLDLLAKNGRVAIVESRGEVKVNPRALMSKESSVFGEIFGTEGVHAPPAARAGRMRRRLVKE